MTSHESIEGVLAIIREWISTNVHGVVWIRYISDVSRDVCIGRLRAGLAIPPVEFAPPQPDLAFDWLEDVLNTVPDSDPLPVISLSFPPSLNGNEDDLIRAFYSLNLRREDLIQRPVIQLWWMPEHLSGQAELVSPDLVSWFKIRATLRELPAPSANAEEFVDPATLRVAPNETRIRSLRNSERRVESARAALATSKSGDTRSLANALRDLSLQQSAYGLWLEALQSAMEATELWRANSLTNREAFLPNLAASLNNLANRQSAVGQREAALTTAAEAVQHYREMTAGNRDVFLPDLAMSLTNLATMQRAVGEREAALASAAEAVQHFRELTARHSEAFLPNLAGSLNNLAAMQSDVGQREAALATAMEAVQRYRELTAGNREAFLPDLAMSLGALSQIHAARHEHPQAQACLEEALALLLPMAEAHPGHHAQLLSQLAQAYRAACEATTTPPDQDLLDRIAAILPSPQ